MLHRHLNHSNWTLAAIDDVIARGRMQDWKELRDAAASQRDIRERILRLAQPHLSAPYAQRYHFWNFYVRKQSALVVPTEQELLRIKGVLILKRNATRDYLDFAALAERIGSARVKQALAQPFSSCRFSSQTRCLMKELCATIAVDLFNGL